MRKGLVIGTFLPPHAGHHFVIDRACATAEWVIVAVCYKPGQPISGALRARWLQAAHPTVEVRVVADIGADDDCARWAAHTRSFLGYAPDMVFTSESYGEGYARLLGAEHVVVDRSRETFPISATRIRNDPLANLDWVTPDVRAYLVRRVCVVGSESTGKTTLCEKLAARFGAPWVAEYGREYTLLKLRTGTADVWQPAEFVHIAREQQRREDEAARHSPGLVVCDTDAFATEIWLERYLGVKDICGWPARDRPMDLYLLTDPSVPFVADSIRDGERYRDWMFARFTEELGKRSLPFSVLSGDYQARERRAVDEIERLMASRIALG
jgi:HTH-type transcriptional repressor of NAD biosynthesis genes